MRNPIATLLFLLLFLLSSTVQAQFAGGGETAGGFSFLGMTGNCGLPLFLVSDVYKGGGEDTLQAAKILIIGNCNLPPYVASNIYKGGQERSLHLTAQITTNTGCNLPVFISSDIYRGGLQDTFYTAIEIDPICGVPPPPPNLIYAGGQHGDLNQSDLMALPSCALPPFALSDIFKGGFQGNLDRQEVLTFQCGQGPPPSNLIYAGGADVQNGRSEMLTTAACALPAFAASNIYVGGLNDTFHLARAILFPACAVPPFSNSPIYAGGVHGAVGQQAALQYLGCNTSPVSPSPSMYAGGEMGVLTVSVALMAPACGLPPVQPSLIYAGGIHQTAVAASIIQTPVCGVPPFVASNIYAGGRMDTSSMALVLQTGVCGPPASVASDIYRGDGHADGFGQVILTNSSCLLPVFTASDIYRGGLGGNGEASLLMFPNCNGAVAATSDIYKGGNQGFLDQSFLFLTPVCNLPVAIASQIYGGGSDDAIGSVYALTSGNCSLPVAISSNIYGGGIQNEVFVAALTQSSTCNLPTFVASNIFHGGSEGSLHSAIQSANLTPTVQLSVNQLSTCLGEQVQLTAQASAAGSTPNFQWFINGQAGPTGNPAIFSNLVDQDQLSVTLTPSLTCASNLNQVSAGPIQVTVNAALGANTILGNPTQICVGSGGVMVGSGLVSGPGNISYIWENSLDSSSWQTISGAINSQIFTGPISADTWYRRIVSSDLCQQATMSNPVKIEIAPPPTAIFSGASQTGDCFVSFQDGWVHFPSSSNPNELLLSIRSANPSVDLASTMVVAYISPYHQIVNGYITKYRHYDIVPLINGPAKVRFYFSQSDFDSLTVADPQVTSVQDLLVSRFQIGQTTGGQLIQPDTIMANTPFPNVYTMEVSVPGFSSFFFHGPSPTPLPVDLVSFKANCAFDSLFFNWTTAGEINNSHFLLEQSADLDQWTPMSVVEGNGTSSLTHQYQTVVSRNRIMGEFFRLVQVDWDGKATYYPAISKTCKSEGFQWSVYPNPAQGTFYVQVQEEAAGNGLLRVLNGMGQNVYEEEVSWPAGGVTLTISPNFWSSGVYTLDLETQQRTPRLRLILTQP